MEAEIESVKENPLLDRREVTLNLKHEGEETPAREDVKTRFSAENGVSKDNVDVENIFTGYGSRSSVAELKVHEEFEYDEDLEKGAIEESSGAETSEEYEEIVSGTITDAKQQLKELDDPDWDAALEAEKQNKDRKTLKEWLQNRE